MLSRLRRRRRPANAGAARGCHAAGRAGAREELGTDAWIRRFQGV